MFGALWVGLKGLIRRPGLAVAIVVPLAIATAVSAALFSIADGLYFRPLPLKDADRTVTVSIPSAGPRLSQIADVLMDTAKSEDFLASFEQSPLFTGTVGSVQGGHFNTTILEEIGLQVAAVDIHFFERFGLWPAYGRVFTVDDQATALALRAGVKGVLPVVLSDAYWRREFGGDISVVGEVSTLAERQVLIVGVMKPGVKFPGRTDVWTPRRQGKVFQIRGFAQIAPGVTLEQVRGAFPLLDFTPLRDSLRPKNAGAVLFIFGTALSLLLLAWVQVGGLVLTSATDRLREIAVRVSLGASTRRIVGHFAAESFWLAISALVLAWVGVQPLTEALIVLLPPDLTSAQYLQPDSRTFLFCSVTTVVGFALLTLTPLGLTRRVAPVVLMRGVLGESLSAMRARKGLLVAQVAFTSFLLYVASLSGFSYLNVLRYDYGFDADNVVITEPPLPPMAGRTPQDWYAEVYTPQRGRVAAAAERLRHLPGVQVATAAMGSPIPTWRPEDRYDVRRFDGRLIDPVPTRMFSGGPDIVEALGATVLVGTGFNDPEYRGRTDIVLINETLAKQLSPWMPAVGKRLRGEAFDATIVGVIRDLVDSTPDTPAAPLVIQTAQARGTSAHHILIRTSDGAQDMMPTIRKVLEEDFGPIRSTQLRLLADDVEKTVVPWRGRASVLGLVAALGLPLAIVGLSSGLFFLVRTRTRELGIRLALGALPEQARAIVLAYAGKVVLTGGAIGVVSGALVGQAMDGQLFGVGSVSIVTILTVGVLVGGLAWCAAYIPARRASQVNPATVLRAE
ncbi:MAG: ABC transporter permease [Acidobacteria bacterium]|nr:ABC transporter permease [Acidobacteriota bacterium]